MCPHLNATIAMDGMICPDCHRAWRMTPEEIAEFRQMRAGLIGALSTPTTDEQAGGAS